MIKIQETATRLLLSGPLTELNLLKEHYSYKPDGYWHSDLYQLWRRHQSAIKKATLEGNIRLAESLRERKVGWDGTKCAMKFSYRNGQLIQVSLLRGHLDDLKEFCRDSSIELNLEQCLKNPFQNIVIDDIPDNLLAVQLDEEQWQLQKPLILEWLLHGISRIKVTVSGGKTAMFCTAAAFIKDKYPTARFLYVTPAERLVGQVTKEAKKFLPDWDITQFGGKVKDNSGKDMVVCTDAVIRARHKELLVAGFFKTFTGILIDENHRAVSSSYQKVLLSTPSYFRFSASDTTRELNFEKNLLLTGLCGKIYDRLEAGELIKLDRLATPTIEVISCEAWKGKFDDLENQPLPDTEAWILGEEKEWIRGKYVGPAFELDKDGEFLLNRRKEKIQIPGLHQISVDGETYNAESRWCLLERRYDKAITTFKERNEIIASKAAEASSRGRHSLIIATRTLHVLILESLLKKKVDPDLVKVLYSIHSSDQRDETFHWLKTTPGAVLISPLLKVGVSIDELNSGFVADYVADYELLNQMIGRFVRHKPDGTPNEAEVTIFQENQNDTFARSSRRLINRLKQIDGYKWKETNV